MGQQHKEVNLAMEANWKTVLTGVVLLKFLLIPCYFSTDFDVHRNWLAITHTLPLNQWYTEETSEWTLDYPPFFAWFQYLLAQFASFFDPNMLAIQKEPYFSQGTLFFQRLTVILGDLILVVASIRIAKLLQRTSKIPPQRTGVLFSVAVILIVCNAGLILVDSIHFQYNGLLTAILLISIKCVLKEQYLMGAFWYFALVNFKHIYLYIAPAYLAFYLRNYCLTDRSRIVNFKTLLGSLNFWRVLYLCLILLSVCAVSFGPFVYYGQFLQVLSRLFPFKRGLTHAYWAPNFWSLYNFVDFVLFKASKKIGMIPESTPAPGYVSGLVQEYAHSILPSISPFATFVITAVAIAPFCLTAALSPKRKDTFLSILTFCAFCSYLFGWHVHEKAVLLITVPLAILALRDYRYARLFIIFSTIGHFSLFPLFFTAFESPIKYLVVGVYEGFTIYGLSNIFKINGVFPFLRLHEAALLLFLLPMEIYCSGLHFYMGFNAKAPFLPLMVTSVYCAIGVVYCWLLFAWYFLCDELSVDVWWNKKVWAKQQSYLRKQLITKNTKSWQDALLVEDLILPQSERLRLVGGLDISTPDGDDLNACVCLTVLKYPELDVIYSVCEPAVIDKPYIAGFLAFREVGPMVNLMKRLQRDKPDMLPQVLLIDGNGILHPRGFGLACHVGVLLDIPTVGVAKNLHMVSGLIRDIRRYEEELVSAGQTIPLQSKDGELLGFALRSTEESKNPVFVSVGHNISLASATALVINSSKYRVPEPIRQADQLSRKMVQIWF